MISADHLERQLRTIIDGNRILPPQPSIPVKITVFPENEQQIGELVKWATKDRITLLPLGGGTYIFPGIEDLHVAISLTKMNHKIEHVSEDLIATVPAGMTFKEVRADLSSHGQMIPLDQPGKHVSTIGGMVSVNVSGPSRHRYGTARDWVIETRIINADGEAVKSGAKVVKNVSGYDLNKLYIGARGTLGILTYISFKLAPIPESSVTFRSCYNSLTDANALTHLIRQEYLDIEKMVIIKGKWTPGKAKHWWVLIEISGSENGLKPQIEHLSKLHDQVEVRRWNITSKEDSQHFWNVACNREKSDDSVPKEDIWEMRMVLPKRELLPFLVDLSILDEMDASFNILPTSGICTIGIAGKESTVTDTLNSIIKEVKVKKGWVEFVKMPPDSNFERWPILPPSFPWMQKIKREFDPNNIFAPGTFIGGI
ncbi:MAG: FAD-binding oxidoreductase [Candidatus Marinimicrobia bacterium]|nr:FAD-binding oxidoreductase [Candidatus Neomarinimicrobiota bacterium]